MNSTRFWKWRTPLTDGLISLNESKMKVILQQRTSARGKAARRMPRDTCAKRQGRGWEKGGPGCGLLHLSLQSHVATEGSAVHLDQQWDCLHSIRKLAPVQGWKPPERVHMSLWAQKQQFLQEKLFHLTKNSLCTLFMIQTDLPSHKDSCAEMTWLFSDDLTQEGSPLVTWHSKHTGIWSSTGWSERLTHLSKLQQESETSRQETKAFFTQVRGQFFCLFVFSDNSSLFSSSRVFKGISTHCNGLGDGKPGNTLEVY